MTTTQNTITPLAGGLVLQQMLLGIVTACLDVVRIAVKYHCFFAEDGSTAFSLSD